MTAWRRSLYGVASWLLVVLTLGSVTAAGDDGRTTTEIPEGRAPTIDGLLSDGEWEDAAEVSVLDGLAVYVKHQGTVLYIGVRASERSVANVLIALADEVRILHSSAALGTATYRREADLWRLETDFVWRCRDTSGSLRGYAERTLFLETEGWVASTTFSGAPGELEYQIDWREEFRSVAILVAPISDPKAILAWPVGAIQGFLPGPIPASATFAPETWAAIALEPPCGDPAIGTIAFSSSRDGNTDIYALDIDGGTLRRITTSPAEDLEPCWSPDGSRLGFQSRRPAWSLFTIMADGSDERGLGVAGWSPAWSPDGSSVAYSTGSVIRAVAADAGRGGTLVPSCGDCGRPAWSPDGRTLLFQSNIAGSQDLYALDMHSLATQRLTLQPSRDFLATWSPGGDRLVFTSDRDGNLEIYTMDAGGTNVIRITNHPAVDMLPSWSPSGEWIAFVSERDGNREIYIMKPDGSCLRRLTDNPGDDMYPAWRPE